jgi:transcriptional regulator with XRE-family HTH domain
MRTRKRASELLKKEIGEPTFGMMLRSIRLNTGLSQSAFGVLIGITKSVVCDIEKGRQAVSPNMAIKIAKKTGFSVLLAVKLSLQDQVNKTGIKAKVELLAA